MAAVGQPRGRLHHRLMSLHGTEAGDETDQRRVRRHVGQRGPEPAGRRARRAGAEALGVDPPRHGHHALGSPESRGQQLQANGLGHGHHEVGGLVVQPAVERVRPHRLDDVARAHEGPAHAGEPDGQRGQPVLLAAMDVEHPSVGQPAHDAVQVGGVGDRLHAAGQLERLDAGHPRRTRSADHPRLAAPLADERHVVAGALQLHGRARGPVGVRRPSPARHDLPDHERRRSAVPRRLRASRYTSSTPAAWASGP